MSRRLILQRSLPQVGHATDAATGAPQTVTGNPSRSRPWFG